MSYCGITTPVYITVRATVEGVGTTEVKMSGKPAFYAAAQVCSRFGDDSTTEMTKDELLRNFKLLSFDPDARTICFIRTMHA